MPTTTGSSTETKRARLFAVVVAAAIVAAAVGVGLGLRDRGEPTEITAKLGGRAFTLALALDPASRMRGLMHRKSMADDAGMLFVFTDLAPRRFWMKNCFIDLDVVFIDSGGRIVAIGSMTAPPPDLSDRAIDRAGSPHAFGTGGKRAQYVIELNAGLADNLGLSVGDSVDLPYERLKRWAR